jgi:heme exporter protein CcmD
MDPLAKHVGYVYAAYGISAFTLVALFVWTLVRNRKAKAAAEKP